MNTHTFYIYTRAGSVEVLKLQFAHIATIHRVSPVAAELLHIEVVCAHANLFVRVEGNTDITMLYLRMVSQPAHCLYNLCNARLVVGP